MADEDKNPNQNASVVWAKYSQIAFILPAAVVIGLLLGKLADHLLHTKWMFLVGIIVGSIAGFIDLIRTVTKKS
jgi:ATP synthase protein I